ncbi:YceD family protein [Yoonia sp.]|uniref:YceD family protein n=1 Tax=Yoonia sp. TaxID=2212373 RepID=UPI00391AF148
MDTALPEIPRSPLRLSDLTASSGTQFALAPDAGERGAIADALGIIGIRKLRFDGKLTPQGRKDWVLTGTLGATVVQECVVTLAPVTTRIDETVTRSYLADMPDITGTEVEMPQDDTAEPLPETIDLYAVLTEALALALPLYPRADGAELDQTVYTEKGVTPLTDEAAKPFAGLGALRDSLKDKDD